jgi:transmembrane sensor
MSFSSTDPLHDPNGVETAAAEWLARRDRGMTAAEQDAYLQWLRASPAHGTVIVRLEKTWAALDQLSEWRPANSRQPNPDLLAVPRRRFWRWPASLAAAAAIVFLVTWWHASPRSMPARSQAIIHPGPERLVLEDGSIVELNAGAKVDVRFSAEERRVELVRGEAHFTVAKNPARPFIVSANKFAVRAVGTAFNVSMDREAVSVLVTEGRVRIDIPATVKATGAAEVRELSHVAAGQHALLNVAATGSDLEGAGASGLLKLRDVTPAEIEQALSWQGLRLEFVDMALKDVVAEFNRYNQQKLVVRDPKASAILVGGSFRADNVETFVRLLESSFGVKSVQRGNEIALESR